MQYGDRFMNAEGTLPDFSRDPHGWFSRVRSELVEQRWHEILQDIEPAQWSGEGGHAWRIMRSPHGIEIRPDLVGPFIHLTDAPKVTAIAIGERGDAIEVELTTRDGRWVDRFPADAFDIASLGDAMLEERELPHDNLPRLFPAAAADEGR
jgi:hypothetical protein